MPGKPSVPTRSFPSSLKQAAMVRLKPARSHRQSPPTSWAGPSARAAAPSPSLGERGALKVHCQSAGRPARSRWWKSTAMKE